MSHNKYRSLSMHSIIVQYTEKIYTSVRIIYAALLACIISLFVIPKYTRYTARVRERQANRVQNKIEKIVLCSEFCYYSMGCVSLEK